MNVALPTQRDGASELELLYELTQATSEAADLADALTHVLHRICATTTWTHGESWLVGDDGVLERGPARHPSAPEGSGAAAASEALATRVCDARTTLWEDVDDGPLARGAAVGVPILAGSECVGAMVFRLVPRTPSADRAAILVSVAAAQLGAWLKRKRAEDAVRASEERLRLLVEHVGDAVFMLTPDGRIATWSPVAQRMLGYSEEEAIGAPAAMLHGEDAGADALTSHLERARRDGRCEDEGWRRRRDATRFWARAVTCPIRNAAGEVTGYAKIIRDLTAMRAAEEITRQRARDLARSNRELEEFASIASHDLQEPLRKILAFGERLRTRCAGSLDEKGTHYLERVEDASRRMQLLVNDLLTYSRVASRQQPFVPVSLHDVAHEVVRDLETMIERQHGRVEVGPLPTLEADATQMRQLLQNLIVNALKFCTTDRAPVVKISSRRIETIAPNAQVRWEILVEDEGIGFDEKYLDRIFGMLQRLHGRSEYEGTGMGLAICRRIAERHQGEITARSLKGQGTTFVVTLPERREETGGTT